MSIRQMALIMLALVAALAPAARAQDSAPRISARASSSTAWLGDAVRYTISVETTDEPRRPVVEAPGFEVEDNGESRSQSLQIVNGRRRASVSIDFHYLLRPLRAGALQIPPVDVVVGGATYRTQPVWLEVKRPGEAEGFDVVVRPEKTTCYVGEPVTLNITWYFERPVRSFWPALPVDEDKALLDSPQGLPAVPEGIEGRQAMEQEINGRQVRGVIGGGTLEGRPARTYTFEQIVTPLAPGQLQVGPATIALDEIVGEDPAGFFDSPFRDRTRTRRVVIASDPVILDVRPLPAEGRPAGFTGLVGPHDIQLSADRTAANVGDPVALTLRIRGPEPMRGVRPPTLDDPRILDRFRIDSEGWRIDQSAPGQRQYVTTVRPRSGEVTEFPALELPYFDPEAGQYRIARTNPAPLRVRQTSVVTAEDAEFGPAPVARRSLGAGPGGLLANAPAEVALRVGTPALALGQMAPALGVGLLGPPAVCALALAVRTRRERSASPSRRAALRAARRRLRSAGEGPDGAASAMQVYFGMALRAAPGAITAHDAAEAIEGHDPDLARSVRTLLEDCDAARYRAGAVGDRSLGSRAGALLRELAREGLPR